MQTDHQNPLIIPRSELYVFKTLRPNNTSKTVVMTIH